MVAKAGKWVVTAAALAGGFVLLSGFGPRRQMNPEKVDKFLTFRINDALDDIKATPEQREKILAIKDQLLPEFLNARTDRRETRQQLVAQWRSENPDPKAVYAAIDAEVERRRALAHKAADALLQVHAILTPEQREQLQGRFGHAGFMDEGAKE